MLHIDNLHANVGNNAILQGISLQVRPGEVHAIMGPNGSGKSTLTKVLLGHNDYQITKGSIQLDDKDLVELSVEKRAQRGIFVGFQYPVEVPGVNNTEFLRLASNAMRQHRGEAELSKEEFAPLLDATRRQLHMDELFLERDLNSGYSGGQKKRNEVLQMFMLQPRLAVLDETDSGLDIDALHHVADGINAYRSPEHAIVLITHYQRLLDLVQPDRVHVLASGRIIASGGPELATRLEAEGYDRLLAEAAL
jgi:Fe-S cluster assembly ATP-binding protein